MFLWAGIARWVQKARLTDGEVLRRPRDVSRDLVGVLVLEDRDLQSRGAG